MNDHIEKIEITKDGIKMSYIRYLADCAMGFVLILYLIYQYLILSSTSPYYHFVSSEDKIFIIFLFLLLSFPIGLIFNATGWYLLGPIYQKILEYWVNNDTYLTLSTKREQLFSDSIALLKITDKNYLNMFYNLNNVLEAYGVEPNIDYIKGVKRFIRSLTIFLLLMYINEILNTKILSSEFYTYTIVFLVLFSYLILLGSLLSFEILARIFKKTYFICKTELVKKTIISNGNIDMQLTIEEIVKEYSEKNKNNLIPNQI